MKINSGCLLGLAIWGILMACGTRAAGAEQDVVQKVIALRQEATHLSQAGDHKQASAKFREAIRLLESAKPPRTDFDTIGFFEHWLRFLPMKN